MKKKNLWTTLLKSIMPEETCNLWQKSVKKNQRTKSRPHSYGRAKVFRSQEQLCWARPKADQAPHPTSINDDKQNSKGDQNDEACCECSLKSTVIYYSGASWSRNRPLVESGLWYFYLISQSDIFVQFLFQHMQTFSIRNILSKILSKCNPWRCRCLQLNTQVWLGFRVTWFSDVRG